MPDLHWETSKNFLMQDWDFSIWKKQGSMERFLMFIIPKTEGLHTKTQPAHSLPVSSFVLDNLGITKHNGP